MRAAKGKIINMKLNTEQIRTITQGAEYVTETDEGRVSFHRFTVEQERLYEECGNADFFQKTFATAGVQLAFRTDSETIFLKVRTEKSTTRSFFSHDVLVNGERIGSLDNFSDCPLPQNYINASFPLGVFSKQFDLGAGEKEVRILFPFSVISEVEELSLSEAMKKLPERENYIINLRFFQGKTQMEVAEYIGISQAQVSRLEKNALRTMKKYLTF